MSVDSQKRGRPQLPPVSDEMRAWSSALSSEISTWPHAEARSFFGFTALYRKDKDRMFAALPRTRALETPNSFAFKFENISARMRAQLESDPRISAMHLGNARWFTFEISSGRDLHDALEWLAQAYEKTAKTKASK